MNTYRAHGKLLLTGEYLVLKGALALALPTRLGQTLTVEPMQAPSLQWDAYRPDGPWFSATFHPATLAVLNTDDRPKADKLATILKALREQHSGAFEPGLRFETHLEFPTEWGLGSSSTLISNLARWAGVNPYELLQSTLGGSGYDIACATADTPLFYRLENGTPQVTPVAFDPPFADHLFLVYQGKKQHSSDEVKSFNRHWEHTDLTNELQTVSALSAALPTITYFEDFCTLLQVHEDLLSRCLGREPVQRQFPGFDGVLKSLGAWGGDFLLAATEQPFESVVAFFEPFGLDTVFRYHDIIL
ncbi:MAG: hypothetical protein J5831_05525 [Bacteroidales bacterium]|nr:hypothetical protein [Bacteroidales bacterium]